MNRRRQVAAFILAGGASSRMGQDKGLLEFGGTPLIVHTARLLEPLVASVTVVGAPREYERLGLRTIPDAEGASQGPGEIRLGPLAGVAASLAATRFDWNLILACDLPYLSAQWLDWLLGRTIKSRAEAVIPRTERGLEPLAGAYQRACGPLLAAALARGTRKVIDAIEELRVELVYEREWRRFDPRALVLRNMNTRADYDQARTWWETEREKEVENLDITRPARKLFETRGT